MLKFVVPSSWPWRSLSDGGSGRLRDGGGFRAEPVKDSFVLEWRLVEK
jgi:hypothetical protein